MSAPFVVSRRVEFRDTDAAGIMHFSMYLVYLEQAEHELLRHLGLSVHMPHEGDVLSWPRVSARCDYRSAVRFEEPLVVELTVRRLGTSSVTYAGRFLANDRLVAEGELTAVCCVLTPDAPPRPIPIPDDIRARLAEYLRE